MSDSRAARARRNADMFSSSLTENGRPRALSSQLCGFLPSFQTIGGPLVTTTFPSLRLALLTLRGPVRPLQERNLPPHLFRVACMGGQLQIGLQLQNRLSVIAFARKYFRQQEV